jgi:hypothetical protein
MMNGRQGLHPAFSHGYYLFRRKVFKIFGGAFHVYDENKQLLLYARQKAFKLREDFRVYSDTTMQTEMLAILTPQILDISATYGVRDATTGEVVGALKRKGLKSIFKDEWVFLGPQGQELGRLKERSVMGALMSRWIKLIPQHYVVVTPDGREVAAINQRFNPFVLKYGVTIPEAQPAIDRRLLIAAGVLLAGIEGRQQ